MNFDANVSSYLIQDCGLLDLQGLLEVAALLAHDAHLRLHSVQLFRELGQLGLKQFIFFFLLLTRLHNVQDVVLADASDK